MAYKNKEDGKAYRLKNKEKIAASEKAWRKANPEKTAATKKAWKQENPEKHFANNKAYLLRLNITNKKVTQRTLAAWSIKVRTIQPKCMTCGSTENLHAHHIAPKVDYPELALLLLNGITLCENCHIKVHSTI